jgi:hypothetical protein
MFIGTLIAGFVDAFVPPHVMERMLPRNISLAGYRFALRMRRALDAERF